MNNIEKEIQKQLLEVLKKVNEINNANVQVQLLKIVAEINEKIK